MATQPGEYDFLSPDGRYGLTLFGYLQINPPQSLDLIFTFRFEIVKEAALGESGIQFDLGNLYMFPALFEDALKGPLAGYRAYAKFTTEEWGDPARRREALARYWMWTSDSRYLVMLLSSAQMGLDKHNRVALFGLATGRYLDREVRGLPCGADLWKIGKELIVEMETQPEAPTAAPVKDAPANVTYDSDHGAQARLDRKVPKSGPVFDYGLFTKARDKHMALICVSTLVIGSFAMWMALTFNHFASGWALWALSGAFGMACTSIVGYKEWRNQKMIPPMIEQYLAMGDIAGVPYEQFCQVLGKPASVVKVFMVDRGNEPGSLVIWNGCSYHICICFDSGMKAVSVKSERLPVKF